MRDPLNADVSQRITSALVDSLAGVVRASGASAVFVYADALQGQPLPLPEELCDKVFYLSRTIAEQEQQETQGRRYVRVPNVNLSRLGQIKIAVFLALTQGLVQRGDVIVCLTGLPASGALDMLLIVEADRVWEIFAATPAEATLPEEIDPQVVQRVVDIAAELGAEGREGKPVGSLFVVGDAQHVASLSRQLILNPFKGYTEQECNILDPQLEETIKELCMIDGAFIIEGNGVIRTCGAYLKTSLQDEVEYSLPQGLGARHHTAAGITAVTRCIAITVSESTGTVTVFRNGRVVTEIEKLRMRRRREL